MYLQRSRHRMVAKVPAVSLLFINDLLNTFVQVIHDGQLTDGRTKLLTETVVVELKRQQ